MPHGSIQESFAKLLLTYEPTAEGRAALDATRSEAQLRGASVLAARHVKLSGHASALPQDAMQPSPETDTPSGQEVAKLREELEAVAQDLRSSGIACDALLLTHPGDPSEALLQLADDENVGLIVIGMRRRSPVGKLVMGSVAQDILLKANCPVLSVKADS